MTWGATREWTLAWVTLLVLQGLLPTASVYLTKILVDRIAEALNMGLSWEAAAPVVWPAALMAGLIGLVITGGALVWIGARVPCKDGPNSATWHSSTAPSTRGRD